MFTSIQPQKQRLRWWILSCLSKIIEKVSPFEFIDSYITRILLKQHPWWLTRESTFNQIILHLPTIKKPFILHIQHFPPSIIRAPLSPQSFTSQSPQPTRLINPQSMAKAMKEHQNKKNEQVVVLHCREEMKPHLHCTESGTSLISIFFSFLMQYI